MMIMMAMMMMMLNIETHKWLREKHDQSNISKMR